MKDEDLLNEDVSTNIVDVKIVREAIKASSNLLTAKNPIDAAKISGALSLLTIASNIRDSRHNLRLINAARNLIRKSIGDKGD